MKRFAIFALTLLVSLFPVAANAEEATVVPGEEVWSATVLRVDTGSLFLRIDAIGLEDDGAAYPWDEEEVPPAGTPAPEATEAPELYSLASEDAGEDDAAIGVQLVRIAEDAPVWRRADEGFEEATAADIAEGDLLTLRVRDGTALEIVIEASDPAAGAIRS